MVGMVNTYRIRINIDNSMMDFVGYGNATNVVMETCLFEHDILKNAEASYTSDTIIDFSKRGKHI